MDNNMDTRATPLATKWSRVALPPSERRNFFLFLAAVFYPLPTICGLLSNFFVVQLIRFVMSLLSQSFFFGKRSK